MSHHRRREGLRTRLGRHQAAAGRPAGTAAWLAGTRVGEHERAWRQLTVGNPLSAIHGRVCYESACDRAELDSSVWIHSVEDRRLLAVPVPQPEPRPVGRTSIWADGHDGEHQR